MNVREEILREKIDPFLSPERLTAIAQLALAETGEGEIRAERSAWRRSRSSAAGAGIGSSALAFSSGEPEIVYKISPVDKDEQIIREYRVLGYFVSRTSLPVPRPLLIDSTGRLLPGTLLVMTRIPGVALHRLVGLLTPEMADGLTDQIASQVIELHKVRSSGFGGVELEEGSRQRSWADFWLPRFDAVFADLASGGLVSQALLHEIANLRPLLPAALDIGPRSTLTHYDIWSGNVMVDFEGSGYPGRPFVSGYVDIPGYWSDYARELSFMEMFGLANDRFYDRYWSVFPEDETFTLRKNIYNLKMHLKHITMYPDQLYYRQGAEEALGHIKRHL